MSKRPSTITTLPDRHEWSAVLAQLRVDGVSPVESIKITRTVLHLSLGEAKSILHDSGLWADLDDNVAEVHDALESTAAELGAGSH